MKLDVTTIEKFDLPLGDVEDTLYKWVEESIELRYGAGNDSEGALSPLDTDASYDRVLHELYRVRKRADRVEYLLSRSTQTKGRARRMLAQAKFEADMRKAEAMRENASRRSSVTFSSAKERESEAALDSFEQLREEHAAQRLSDYATEAQEVISKIYWQLSEMRKDLRATLHALEFASTLEH